MKLQGGSSLFTYDSMYWTSYNTHNPIETIASPTDDIDAKLPAFNTEPIKALKICYRTLENCYDYDLGYQAASAQELFCGGYGRSNDLGGKSRKEFTDIFLKPETEITTPFGMAAMEMAA